MTDTPKPSKVEGIKEESGYLKGKILEELADGTDIVSNESYELLKFHGTYFGYDRDSATERKKAGLDKEYEFMIRLKIPGGRLTAKQYVAVDDIAEKYANKTLRITTRETFQLHCVVKDHLKPTITEINETLLTTIGGCGDVVRNINCVSAPISDAKHKRMMEDTMRINEFTIPKTSAYHEIWVDGEQVNRDQEDLETLYGKFYLPRKFKIGLGFPEDNSVDVLTNDIAIIMIFDGDELKGYNFALGGGLGMTHNKPETYPRLATPIAFVEPDDLIPAVEAVVKLQRDHGDRSNRKRARLKYVLDDNGLEWTRKTFEEYIGKPLADPVDMPEFKVIDHMGWHEQGDGKWYLGIPVSSGRIADVGEEKTRTGLRQVISEFGMNLILTADQNIILCDIEEGDKEAVTKGLKAHGITLVEEMTSVSRNAFACVALPTCGKALAEAERVKNPMIEAIEQVMDQHGVLDERISVRIAGCPNGCSRPYVGDIGIVGRMPGHYVIFIGGDFECTRLNTAVFDKVPEKDVPKALDPLFALYAKDKQGGEGFGDFCTRVGIEQVVEAAKQSLSEYKWAA